MSNRNPSARWPRIPVSWGVLFLVGAIYLPIHAAADDLHFPARRTFDMQHIRLDLAVNLEKKRVQSEATLEMTALEPAASVRLDAVDFDVHKVAGQIGDASPGELACANDGEALEVYFGRVLPAGTPVELRVLYTVTDPESGLHFFAPSEDEPNAPVLLWSQGEPTYQRYWIPCFDHPNEMQTTEVIATVDEKYQVLSNGRLIEQQPADDLPGKVVYHWKQEQPHAVYLVTLVVGEFATGEETWRGKPVLYYVPVNRGDEIEPTFKDTTRMLDFFSDALGVEYPWVKYAQVVCYQFGGGMENTSATTLGLRALHTETARIDSSPDGLLSHELAHQWFGDLVTCADWAHTWLNEGFASYFEALWDEHDNGPDAFARNMLRKARSATRGDKDRPIVDRAYPNPGSQFDARAYPKGAWVCHMLRRRLGDETFFQALHAYLTRYAHTPVETADLRMTIEHVTGQNFERFFYDWTERPGHPVVESRFEWNQDEKTAELTVKQTQEAEPFHFPLIVEFRTEPESAVRVEREMTERELTLVMPLATRPMLVRIDPDQSVLMELEEHKPRDLWVAQLHEDANAALRIRAAKHLAEGKTDADQSELAKALKREPFWGVQEEIAEALGDIGSQIARDALLEGLRSDNPRVRRPCAEALGNFDEDEQVRQAIADLIEQGDPSDRVLAATIRTYGELKPEDVIERLEPLLERKSRRDQVRTAALEALGASEKPGVLDVLTAWAQPGKPLMARRTALEAAAKAAALPGTTETDRETVLELASTALDNSSARLRSAAAGALGTLGGSARAHLGRLREVAKDDTSRWVRRAAERAVKKIEEDQPAQEQIADLRMQLDELREQNEKLQDQVATLEARSKTLEQMTREPAAGVLQESQQSAGSGAGVSPGGADSSPENGLRP
jgi:aminopeptidase N